MIFVDGVDIGDPTDVALRDRRMLSADGIFVVVATISEQDGSSVAEPEVIFRGVPYPDDADAAARRDPRHRRGLAGARGRRGDPRDRPAPAGPARRPRRVRLRAPAPPPDGAAGRRRRSERRHRPRPGPRVRGGGDRDARPLGGAPDHPLRPPPRRARRGRRLPPLRACLQRGAGVLLRARATACCSSATSRSCGSAAPSEVLPAYERTLAARTPLPGRRALSSASSATTTTCGSPKLAVRRRLAPLLPGVSVREALSLDVVDAGRRLGRIFLTHGHQGTAGYEWRLISHPALRLVWRPFQRLLKIASTSPSQDWSLRERHETAMFEQARRVHRAAHRRPRTSDVLEQVPAVDHSARIAELRSAWRLRDAALEPSSSTSWPSSAGRRVRRARSRGRGLPPLLPSATATSPASRSATADPARRWPDLERRPRR